MITILDIVFIKACLNFVEQTFVVVWLPLGHANVPSMFLYVFVLIRAAFKCVSSGDHSQVTRRKHGEDTEKT